MLTLLPLLIACRPAFVDLDGPETVQGDSDSGTPTEQGDSDSDSRTEQGDSGSDSGDVGRTEADDDGDGFTEDDGDCDDGDASVNPDAEEIWYDGVDQDCAGDNDFDQNGDGNVSWAEADGTDCDDDGDSYLAVDCPNGNNARSDCDDAHATVNAEGWEDNTDQLDNNCNGLVDGLHVHIEWDIAYECPREFCSDSSEYDYVGTLSVRVADDVPDRLILLGGGTANTAEEIDLPDTDNTTDLYEVAVVAGQSAPTGTTSFGDQAATVTYLYLSHIPTPGGSRCVVWGPQAEMLQESDEYKDLRCVDVTALVETTGLTQNWDGNYE